ncbi:MAG: tRNA uridine-5-carboxymethylaminomethyl(34) synthesis GTPase MnmE [Desulfobacterales bacterium]
MDNNTIAAIATPTGFGGIGIIKISGKGALSIASSIFQRSTASSDKPKDTNSACFSSLKSHQLYYGHVVDPANGRVLDEVLLSVMLAPHTYTMENVVEINTHAGPVVQASILDLVIKKGARLAEPGEFTKRAYLNGRIDLTQAEAVIDIINSRTDKALEIATSQIKGRLKKSVESIRQSLINLLTEIEAAIDFPDDVGEIINTKTAIKVLENHVIVDLKDLIDHYKNAHILRDGLKMVVVGRPNVGKSSLMNRLIQNDRAIVTSIPGTTRDLIEEILNIHGIPVIIADTAGLHETDDPVEVIGIKKTQEYINGSDLVLFMVDASDSLTSEDYKIYETINDKQMILVVNKSDLAEDDFELEAADSWKKIPSIKISALYGSGINELKDLIAKLTIGERGFEVGNKIIPNLRHKIALERSLQLSVSAVEEIRKETPFELIAIDILEAVDTLGEVIGVTVKEDVIDQIFSRFCIGK